MNKQPRKKLIHEGQYLAEVDVELLVTDDEWSPYLSVEDAYKLDDVRKEPRPSRRGFCKPRGNVPPLRYGLPFLPALPSGASWQILVKR
jgi:hypothetical protein